MGLTAALVLALMAAMAPAGPVAANGTAPVAVNDSYTTAEDTALTRTAAQGVLANDTDNQNDPLTAGLVSGPSHGTLTLNADGSFTYTPTANYNGSDSFTYQANDGHSNSNTATVTITITAVNDAPVAVADTYTTAEDTPLVVTTSNDVLTNDTDVDNMTITAILVSQPANGTVVMANNGTFTYTPNANYFGTDTFTYRAFDGALFSAPVTVTITVTSVNDGPIAGVLDTYSTPEDTTLTVAAAQGVLANDIDPDGTSTSLTVIKSNDVSHGTLTLNTDGSFTYTPTANYHGPDSFTYVVKDEFDTYSYQVVVRLTVTPVNDAPVAVADGPYTTVEDTPLTVAAPGLLANDTDIESDPLTAVLATGPSHGTVTVNADGSFVYTPAANYHGSDSFTYVANDGGASSAPVTIPITITSDGDGVLPVTDVPVTSPIAAFSELTYEVVLTAGQTYRFRASGQVTQLVLYDPSDAVVASASEDSPNVSAPADNPGVRTIDYTAPVSGTYRLQVRNQTNVAGSFQVVARTLPAATGPAGETTWYFAEGYTAAGYDEYLTLLNPNDSAAEVTITYLRQSGAPVARTLTVAATSRATVAVHDPAQLGRGVTHGTMVASTNGVGIVAERVLYAAYSGTVNGASSVLGAPATSTEWYFAEGYTAANFDQYLTILNPGPTDANVAITYYLNNGVTVEKTLAVPARSRRTVEVHQATLGVGRDKEVAALVRSTNGVGIVAERALYFRYNATIDGLTTALGTIAPRRAWYFAEGYTGAGFDEYLTILNPNATVADITIDYYLADGSTVRKTLTVAATSRTTVEVHGSALGVGRGQAVSARVSTDHQTGIVVERPMYFVYTPAGGTGSPVDGGHAAAGVPAPRTVWYFAEGYTAAGFDQYLTIMNPNDDAAEVTITYYLADGTTVEKSLTVAATSRATVQVHATEHGVGRGLAVSARVESTNGEEVVVERPMYMRYNGTIDGGHAGPGYGIDALIG